MEEENPPNNKIEDDHEESINHIFDEEEATPVALSKSAGTICGIPSLVADYGSASEDSK